MMKKIICLLVAVAAMFALVSCGECDTHTDADKNGVCDVCEATVEVPGAEFFNAVASAEPTVITTIASATRNGASYVSTYTTTITEDGLIHEAIIERPAALDEEAESAKVTEWVKIVYAGGVYTKYVKSSQDEEYGEGAVLVSAPVVEYLNVKSAITAQNVSTFTITGTTLTATLTPEECANIYGTAVESDNITLSITTVGGRLSIVGLQYTAANGTIVNTNTSYSYAPVSGAAE